MKRITIPIRKNHNALTMVLFFVASLAFFACTPQKELSHLQIANTNTVPPNKNADPASAFAEQSNAGGEVLKRPDMNISLQWDEEQWAPIGNIGQDPRLQVQFYNEASNATANIKVLLHSVKEPIQLQKIVEMEQQGLQSGMDTIYSFAQTDTTLLGVQGIFWTSHALAKDDDIVMACFGFYQNNRYYLLNIEQRATNILNASNIWQDFFQNFSLLHSQASDFEEGVQKPFAFDSYTSEELGFTFDNPQMNWLRVPVIENDIIDASFAISNQTESIFAMTIGNVFSNNAPRPEEIFNTYLNRLGLDPTLPGFILKKQVSGKEDTYTFEAQHPEDSHYYYGKWNWDQSRSILVVAWSTKSSTSEKSALTQVVQNFTLLPKYTTTPSVQTKQFNAVIFNQIGLNFLRTDQPLVALSFFERANLEDPNDPLYLMNCGFVYQLRELFGPGIQHFSSQIELVKQHGKLLYILGEMHEAVREYAAARKYYEMALLFMPYDQELVINLSDALWGLGQLNLSLAVVEKHYAIKPSIRLGVYYAKTLMGLERYAEAVAILQNIKQQYPADKSVGQTLMQALGFLGHHQEALAVSEDLLKIDPNNGKTWFGKGKAQFYLKQYVNAEKSLRKAANAMGTNAEIESFLNATNSFLGKADVSAIKRPIAPVLAFPSSISTLVQTPLDTLLKGESFPVVIHHQEKRLQYVNKQPWVQSELLVLQVLNEHGVSLFQEFTYSYLPDYDRIFVNELHVYNRDFKKKASGKLSQWYITSLKQDGSEGDAQLAHITVPSVEPGDYIAILVSRTSLQKTSYLPFYHHISSQYYPVAKDIFSVITDVDNVIHEEYGKAEAQQIAGGWQWTVQEPTILRKELYMPNYRDFGSGVMVGQQKTWAQVGQQYYTLIQHVFMDNLPVREKASELKGSRIVDESVIYRLNDWVRKNISYRNVAFGGHSLIPTPSGRTLTDRFGDCKDQSLLLIEMLKYLGVPANLALVHLEAPIFEGVPGVDQFNHVIVHIPAGKKWPEMWLDPTDKAGTHRPVPLIFEDKAALIIDKDSSRLAYLPVLENQQEHQAHVYHAVYIENDGSAQFTDSLALFGKFAARFRNQFLNRTKSDQQVIVKNWLDYTFPNLVLLYVNVENIDDFQKPLILKMAFTSRNYFSPTRTGFAGKLPNIWERGFMRLPKVKERHHPLRIPHEYNFISETTVKTAQEKQLHLTNRSAAPEEFEYIEFKEESNITPHSIYLKMQWKTFAVYAEPKEYAQIADEWTFALERTNPAIEISEP
jgi:tetratricopeptide (TPR) repeat protein/transglutaminase-like putative cysteine protease